MQLPWARILLLASVGLLIGAESVYALLSVRWELTAWTLIALFVWAPLLARWSPSRPVLAGLFVGMIAGAFAGGMQALFQRTYLANWPSYAAQVEGQSAVLISAAFLGSGIAAGAATGAVSGLVAWAIVAWRARRRAVVL